MMVVMMVQINGMKIPISLFRFRKKLVFRFRKKLVSDSVAGRGKGLEGKVREGGSGSV